MDLRRLIVIRSPRRLLQVMPENFETECLCGFEISHKFKPRWLLDRQASGFNSTQ